MRERRNQAIILEREIVREKEKERERERENVFVSKTTYPTKKYIFIQKKIFLLKKKKEFC